MSASYDLEVREEAEPDAATRDAIGKGLDAYNETCAGPAGWSSYWLIARDATGAVQAGLRAYSAWRWLFVQWLWVAEPYRHAGTGSRLLARAEEYARAAGAVGIYLDTFSFQAPEFYRRKGFVEFARLDGIPPGHTRIWFKKEF